MTLSDKKQIVDLLKSYGMNNFDNLNKLFSAAVEINEEDHAYAMDLAQEIKDYALDMATMDVRAFHLYYRCLLIRARDYFDDYLLYVEKNRPAKKRFYLPRRNVLKTIVDDLQDLEDSIIDFLGVSLPPRVGKSTLCIFFLSWVMGKRPDSNSAMSGHSGILANGFYDEVLNIITSEEYCWSDVFPEVKFQSKSSENKEITLGSKKRFATLTCRGIDGTWTGAVNISSDGYLYVDDLVRDRTESLSPIRLENRFQDYLNVLVDRKNDGTKELMVGTRWNVLDPLGKIEARNKNNSKYRFRRIPALNENDESNFNYKYGLGFSTEYYKDMRNRLDKNEWEAKFQQRPFVREGLIFPADSLRTYNGVLPEGGFVRVVSACDVAWGGGDALSQPIGYEYENGDIYIPQWIFNRGKKEVTIPIVAGKIKANKIQQINFEANNGGDMYAKYIDDFLKSENYSCSITSTKAPNTMAKMAKIIQYSGDIINRFIFLDEEHRDKEYQEAFEELTMTVSIGKNEHDDAADSCSQLMKFVNGGFTATIEVFERPC